MESNFRNLRVHLRTIRKNWRSNLFWSGLFARSIKSHINSKAGMNFLAVRQSVDRIPTRADYSVDRIREESINSRRSVTNPQLKHSSVFIWLKLKIFVVSVHLTEDMGYRSLSSDHIAIRIVVLQSGLSFRAYVHILTQIRNEHDYVVDAFVVFDHFNLRDNVRTRDRS